MVAGAAGAVITVRAVVHKRRRAFIHRLSAQFDEWGKQEASGAGKKVADAPPPPAEEGE